MQKKGLTNNIIAFEGCKPTEQPVDGTIRDARGFLAVTANCPFVVRANRFDFTTIRNPSLWRVLSVSMTSIENDYRIIVLDAIVIDQMIFESGFNRFASGSLVGEK